MVKLKTTESESVVSPEPVFAPPGPYTRIDNRKGIDGGDASRASEVKCASHFIVPKPLLLPFSIHKPSGKQSGKPSRCKRS
jgi:hypothetical protein